MLVSSVIHVGDQPCKCSLASEVLRRFGELRLQVTGASMLPSVWPGDVLTIRSARLPEISRGDLVLFFRGRRFFVHRVLKVSADRLLTRGDSVVSPDPLVSSDELLGRVVSIARDGAVRAPSKLGAAGCLLAFAVRHSTILCNIVLRLSPVYRRVLRTAALAAVLPPEEAWPN